MTQVIEFATRVDTVFSLIAFIFALGWAAYHSKLKRDEKLALEANSENLDALNNYFRVDTDGLTKQQKFDLALEQIRKGERISKRWILLGVLFGVMLFGYACFHQWSLQARNSETTPGKTPVVSVNDTVKPSVDSSVIVNEFRYANKGLLASFGTANHCESVVETTSESSFSSFVSSDDNTSCTVYGKFTFTPSKADQLDGVGLQFTIVVEFKGTQPGGAFEISGNEGTVKSIRQGEEKASEVVILKNNHQYVFHGNTQVAAKTGGGSSKISVSIRAGGS
ncbi:MAG: hypothetical protein JKY50_00925 [Oleispira sp.]|nr:hypothetical protein [Oleispira sp.]